MTGLAALASASALASSLAMLVAGRVAGVLALCVAQASAASLAAVAHGFARNAGLLGVTAVLAIVLNGFALPRALRRFTGQAGMPASIGARFGFAGTAATAFVLVTAAVAGTVQPAEAEQSALLALGLSMLLLGLLLPVARSHPALPAVGLLAAQNGVILAACAIPVLGLPVLLLAAIPLVPALAVAALWLHGRTLSGRTRPARTPPWA